MPKKETMAESSLQEDEKDDKNPKRKNAPRPNKEEEKALKKVKKEIEELELIKATNKQRFQAILSDESFGSVPSLFTPHQINSNNENDEETEKPLFTVGEFVEVSCDTSPGKNRESGCGFIDELVEVDGSPHLIHATVKYIDGTIHAQVPITDLTVKDYQSLFSSTRGRPTTRQNFLKNTEETSSDNTTMSTRLQRMRDGRSSIEILRSLLEDGTKKRKKKGWHRKELKLNPKFEDNNNNTIPNYTNAEITQLLYEYDMLSAYLQGSKTNKHFVTGKNGKIKKRKKKHNHDSLKYLLYSWGASFDTVKRFRQKALKSAEARGLHGANAKCCSIALVDEEEDASNTENVIDSFDFAEKLFTAEYLYIRKKIIKAKSRTDSYSVNLKDVKTDAKAEFSLLSKYVIDYWEAVVRAHLERQPGIAGIIKDLFRENPAISYHGVENKLNHWCSSSTIQRWVTSREGYRLYVEKVIPSLSPDQKSKHLKFAIHFNNNWGKGSGKYLLLHFDEKWFWGLLRRMTAKTFEDVDVNVMKIYHKCHISKTMGVAVVGMAFEDGLENGGIGLKLLFHRAQSAKVAQRLTRNKDKKVLRKKGDIYYVDCNVTGSDEGTSKNPKFSLLSYFQYAVFPVIEQLVKPGGKFFGYTPVIQGDNAGCHNDTKFQNYVKGYCSSKGWLWEPQAPQMPHMNVLDLAVFPAMSRRHMHLSRSLHGTRVLKEDEIWNAALEVWKSLPASNVANAFVLAKRVADKVIRSKGSNDFLSGVKGTIHSGVREDFTDTIDGNKRKDGCHIKPVFAVEQDKGGSNNGDDYVFNDGSNVSEPLLSASATI